MKHYTKEFDALDPTLAARRVSVARASAEELAQIYPQVAASFMQQVASLATCQDIRRRHHDNIWAIRHRRDGALIGLYAMVMLSPEGHAALLIGDFDAPDPRLSHVAATGDPVAAIYHWGVYAPGIAAAAIPLMAERLSSPDYRHLDLYGNGSTPAGRRIMKSLGFHRVEDPRTPQLFKYERLARRGLFEITGYSL
ncbi:hypothetical protein HMH01_13445 [Halovulum dunhuangense]|uniref:N-acetyltransferase domain-containing protein n=1 Tax=Halovulum dunhuangense TaxID=1505036 RepID=A0A849L5N6_9RHOB|nr:hypothetical protein [Halovulum dunhuangense]NNU81441.1 hypothetical protein [Halovulum dunhuangense]